MSKFSIAQGFIVSLYMHVIKMLRALLHIILFKNVKFRSRASLI